MFFLIKNAFIFAPRKTKHCHEKLISILAAALVIVSLGVSCTKDNPTNTDGGEEQDATGTVSGDGMNFKLSKNGSNYLFSKK